MAAVDGTNDDADARIGDELARQIGDPLPQLFGGQPDHAHLVQDRQRHSPVGTNHHLRRHLAVTPVDDAQRIARPDAVVGQRHADGKTGDRRIGRALAVG